MALVPPDVFGRSVRLPHQDNVGVANALFEHAGVANDEQPRGIRHAAIRKNARALLGADAGRVAEHQAEHGKGFKRWRGHLSLASVKR